MSRLTLQGICRFRSAGLRGRSNSEVAATAETSARPAGRILESFIVMVKRVQNRGRISPRGRNATKGEPRGLAILYIQACRRSKHSPNSCKRSWTCQTAWGERVNSNRPNWNIACRLTTTCSIQPDATGSGSMLGPVGPWTLDFTTTAEAGIAKKGLVSPDVASQLERHRSKVSRCHLSLSASGASNRPWMLVKPTPCIPGLPYRCVVR
jgi:hypothetical protein